MDSPAGMPSMIVTSAWPWDSPAVRNRNIRPSFYPKLLPRPEVPSVLSRMISGGGDLAPPRRHQRRDGGRMNLVADRFVVHDDGRTIDLTTGALVALSMGCAGGVSAQVRWVQRCDVLRALHHQSLAPLVDFGAIGEASRFEAWQCGAAWRGASDVARTVGDRARQFLEASGLSIEGTSACSIHACRLS